MPTRRPLLALPLLLLARPVWATSSWQRDVSELRVGGVDAAVVSARLGVPVRAAVGCAAEALNAGHLEAARLDLATAAKAVRLMGARLVVWHEGGDVIAVRRALPGGLRADLGAALAA